MAKGEVVAQTKGTEVAAPVVDTSLKGFEGLKLGGGLKIVGVKPVTRPVLKQEDMKPFAVTILCAAFQGKELKGTARDGSAKMAPARLMYVLNLETGEEQTMIANAALESGLESAYPDGGYVGKSFAVISRKRDHGQGKTIREYGIREIEIAKE